jgi:hypothetical protein
VEGTTLGSDAAAVVPSAGGFGVNVRAAVAIAVEVAGALVLGLAAVGLPLAGSGVGLGVELALPLTLAVVIVLTRAESRAQKTAAIPTNATSAVVFSSTAQKDTPWRLGGTVSSIVTGAGLSVGKEGA